MHASVLSKEERRFWLLMAGLERLVDAQSQALRDGNFDALISLQASIHGTLQAINQLEKQLDLNEVDALDRQKRIEFMQSQQRANQLALAKMMDTLRADLASLEKKRTQLKNIQGAYREKPLADTSMYFFS